MDCMMEREMVRREGVGRRERSVLPRPDADKEKYHKPISARPPDVEKKAARHILRLEFSLKSRRASPRPSLTQNL